MFTIYQDEAGEWRWRYVSGGNTMADSSEGYTERNDCREALESFRSGARDAEVRIQS